MLTILEDINEFLIGLHQTLIFLFDLNYALISCVLNALYTAVQFISDLFVNIEYFLSMFIETNLEILFWFYEKINSILNGIENAVQVAKTSQEVITENVNNQLSSIYTTILAMATIALLIYLKRRIFKSSRSISYTCCICLDKPVEIVFLPCRHLSVCSSCFKRMKENHERNKTNLSNPSMCCPVCRQAVESELRIFI